MGATKTLIAAALLAAATTTTTTAAAATQEYTGVKPPYDPANRDTTVRPGRFDGKVCLVTGATSGLGMDAALHLSSEGCKTVITGRREDKGAAVVARIRAAGGEATFVRADVTKEEDCERMVSVAVETYGKLDAAFNNAGVNNQLKPTHEFTLEEWRWVLGVNLDGVFLSMKYELKAMLKNEGAVKGSIVNCASIYGLNGAPKSTPYSTSKHALSGLTKSTAHEYMADGIRVNNVNPGFAASELTDPFSGHPAMDDVMAHLHPGSRWVKPEEVSNAVAWLMSEDSAYVNGQNLEVSGGVSASYIPPHYLWSNFGRAVGAATADARKAAEEAAKKKEDL